VSLETLDAVGARIEATEVRNQQGRLLLELPVGEAAEEYRAATFEIVRSELPRILAQAAGVDAIRLGSEAVGLEQGDGWAEVVLAAGDRARDDLVVCADGTHSAMRRPVAGTEGRRRSSGFTA